MYLGFLPLIFKRCHFKKLSRRTLSPFVRSALLFCALIFTFFWLSPAVVAAESSRIELTAEEQAWLAEHPAKNKLSARAVSLGVYYHEQDADQEN